MGHRAALVAGGSSGIGKILAWQRIADTSR